MMASTGTLQVDPSNAEQRRAWDGDDGTHWARHAERYDEVIRRYHHRFLDAAAIEITDEVLDIGCGNGQTTRDAARVATSGRALGVDLSSQMIDEARRRAAVEGVTNARFQQADAQVHAFEPEAFDVAISRTGAMFFGDPVAAFRNIRRALRPAARLALLTWQPLTRNEWVSELSAAVAAGRSLPAPHPEAPGPFSLADADRVRLVLGEAGFTGVDFEGTSEPMCFGRDLNDAFAFVSGISFIQRMLSDLDHDARRGALEALRATIAAHETAQGVLFDSAAWIISARRS